MVHDSSFYHCAVMQSMKTIFPRLKRRQLDAALHRWRAADLAPRPVSGWIKAIREGLGMTATHLAGRLGVAPSTVTRLEQSEADETISLATLRRAAAALECELHYALVPRQSLEQVLESRADAVAREQMTAVAHSMALEAQATSFDAREAQVRELAAALRAGSPRKLWR